MQLKRNYYSQQIDQDSEGTYYEPIIDLQLGRLTGLTYGVNADRIPPDQLVTDLAELCDVVEKIVDIKNFLIHVPILRSKISSQNIELLCDLVNSTNIPARNIILELPKAGEDSSQHLYDLLPALSYHGIHTSIPVDINDCPSPLSPHAHSFHIQIDCKNFSFNSVESSKVSWLLNVARSYKKQVLFKGVNRATDLSKVERLGGRFVHGHYLSKPMRLTDMPGSRNNSGLLSKML